MDSRSHPQSRNFVYDHVSIFQAPFLNPITGPTVFLAGYEISL